MPDITLKGWSGTDFEYKDVPKIWLAAPGSTEENPVLIPFTYGEGSGIKVTSGIYNATVTGAHTIEHGLGVVPDFVAVFPSSAVEGEEFIYQYAMSEAFHALSGATDYGRHVTVSSEAPQYYTAPNLTSTAYVNVIVGGINSADANTFRVGGGKRHRIGTDYIWFALALT